MKKLTALVGAGLSVFMILCQNPPQTGEIEVKSDPTGADVYLDDSLTDKKTNCLLEDVPFGEHKLRLVLEGYFDWERTVELNEDNPTQGTNAGLTQAPCYLKVNSHPQGAAIFLGGEETGFETEHIFSDLEPGECLVELVLEGYEDWDTTLVLVRGDTAVIEAEFDSAANYPPVIANVTASPNPVEPGLESQISCTATDADADPLTYHWESPDEGKTYSTSSFTWTAPQSEGNYRFYVTVSDGQGGFDYDSSLVVTVKSNQGIEAVTMLPAQDVGTREATLLWTSAGPSWMKYELHRSTTPDVQTYGQLILTYNYANGHTRLDTTYTDSDLDPGEDYYYAVLLGDSAGNTAWSNEISLTTTGFEYLDSKPLGGGHGVRLASTSSYVFCASREQSVMAFTVTSSGLAEGSIIPYPDEDNSAWAYDAMITGNLLHVAFGKGGYRSYDISNPFAPYDSLFQNVLTLGGEARTVYALGSAVFVGCTDPATGTNTLVYFDCNNPWALFIDTIYDIPEDIYATGSYVYVAEGNSGLHILSWNPIDANPLKHVSLLSVSDALHQIHIAGMYAYLAAGTQGFVVVDVSNPLSPYQAGKWTDPEGNDSRGLYLSGNKCYLADGPYGLRVLDLSIPLYPDLLGTKDLSDYVTSYVLTDVCISSSGFTTYAVLADWNNAIHLIGW